MNDLTRQYLQAYQRYQAARDITLPVPPGYRRALIAAWQDVISLAIQGSQAEQIARREALVRHLDNPNFLKGVTPDSPSPPSATDA